MSSVEDTARSGTIECATKLDQLCIDTLRTLSIDAVQRAQSGHPGTPMDAAPAVYCLWQRFLTFDPQDPDWPNRDRFVLSAGHASMLLYSVLAKENARKQDIPDIDTAIAQYLAASFGISLDFDIIDSLRRLPVSGVATRLPDGPLVNLPPPSPKTPASGPPHAHPDPPGEFRWAAPSTNRSRDPPAAPT